MAINKSNTYVDAGTESLSPQDLFENVPAKIGCLSDDEARKAQPRPQLPSVRQRLLSDLSNAMTAFPLATGNPDRARW